MVTAKQIRAHLGHNGHECKVRITRLGDVFRHGSADPIDRSKDFWAYMGTVGDVAKDVRREKK